jgi:hypothetical protein
LRCQPIIEGLFIEACTRDEHRLSEDFGSSSVTIDENQLLQDKYAGNHTGDQHSSCASIQKVIETGV